jgi:hypothetical protein
VLHVYAFVEAPASVPADAGIDAAALEAVVAGDVDAVVSRHDSAAPEATEAAIVAHARVVDAIAAANGAVLPARFAGGYADADALRAAVSERESELSAALAHVRGCVELGVRALVPAGERVAAESGAAYMQARLERRRETERLAEELHAPLAALARDATQTVGATERLLLSAAYLVPEEAVAEFRELVARLEEAHPELGIVCTGPWPPYSFATAEAGS